MFRKTYHTQKLFKPLPSINFGGFPPYLDTYKKLISEAMNMGMSLTDCLVITLLNTAVCICLPKVLALMGSNKQASANPNKYVAESK